MALASSVLCCVMHTAHLTGRSSVRTGRAFDPIHGDRTKTCCTLLAGCLVIRPHDCFAEGEVDMLRATPAHAVTIQLGSTRMQSNTTGSITSTSETKYLHLAFSFGINKVVGWPFGVTAPKKIFKYRSPGNIRCIWDMASVSVLNIECLPGSWLRRKIWKNDGHRHEGVEESVAWIRSDMEDA
ncbi:hypothetical protein DFH09DRAFT_1109177 [Mycena vulgaris]|nr:hypothetical protein DFH09DRAFT_1109177 [Mycena vulgaris]